MLPAVPEGLRLEYQEGILCLSCPLQADAGRLWVDFSAPDVTYRRRQALGQEFLVKAVAGRHRALSDRSSHPDKHLIDATAGLGEDAFVLACAGWQVSLLEQSPVVHALLADGLYRAKHYAAAKADAQLQEALSRMHLHEPCDACDRMSQLPLAAVIYLDPMFPEQGKKTRAKKNRFLLQRLHGGKGQGAGMLNLALELAPKVVVKRPRLAPPLDNIKPSGTISGKANRFDIYAGRLRTAP